MKTNIKEFEGVVVADRCSQMGDIDRGQKYRIVQESIESILVPGMFMVAYGDGYWMDRKGMRGCRKEKKTWLGPFNTIGKQVTFTQRALSTAMG